MATPNKTSSASGALWVIALSLAVIAACLVVLVTRQQRQRDVETVQIENVPPTGSTDARRLPKAFSVSPGRRPADEPPPAAEPAVRVVEVETPAQPTVPPPAGPEPIVSSGLAPLTYLATNSPDSSNALSTIRGRVLLSGTPPPENPITMLAENPQCGKLQHGPLTTHFFLVSKEGGLADVFVFISSGLDHQKFPAPTTPVLLNQKSCFFEPYVFGMMTGQKLVVKNSDKILHNVHIDPNPEGPNISTAKNIAEGPGGASVSATFPGPEQFLRIRCDVHPWMFAYACVVDHPFFAVTDANGNFVISNVPPGDYTLTALHRKANIGHAVTQKITVVEEETTTANFTIPAPKPDNRMARQK